MVKSKLISEEDLHKLSEDTDETMSSLPEETLISQDNLIAKISGILKSNKRSKLSKRTSDVTNTVRESETEPNVPTTKNAFNIRKNVAKEPAVVQEPPKVETSPNQPRRPKPTNLNEDEPDQPSVIKPSLGGNSSKPFGSKIGSKPNFMNKAKEESYNARQNLA
uniref:Uncharacterized protein n=1 Tax=Euplotes harpa TaxID=151035 RepID=A0A7S3NB84_9SPIT|mmetsp:Transcript_32250/g.36771  ORF Transcript_32250/g.36771 Transcript_32250/m.36771 type:complete len:164 (+) Transcript_32250:278-769(+)